MTPLPAVAAPPSAETTAMYAKLGAITMLLKFRDDGQSRYACSAAHDLVYYESIGQDREDLHKAVQLVQLYCR